MQLLTASRERSDALLRNECHGAESGMLLYSSLKKANECSWHDELVALLCNT